MALQEEEGYVTTLWLAFLTPCSPCPTRSLAVPAQP